MLSPFAEVQAASTRSHFTRSSPPLLSCIPRIVQEAVLPAFASEPGVERWRPLSFARRLRHPSSSRSRTPPIRGSHHPHHPRRARRPLASSCASLMKLALRSLIRQTSHNSTIRTTPMIPLKKNQTRSQNWTLPRKTRPLPQPLSCSYPLKDSE